MSESNAGYVYVLTNETMPGLVKVGRSKHHPTERARELSQSTGIPTPFEVEAFWFCDDMIAFETAAHRRLAKFRLTANREFFSIELEVVLIILLDLFGSEGKRRVPQSHQNKTKMPVSDTVPDWRVKLLSWGEPPEESRDTDDLPITPSGVRITDLRAWASGEASDSQSTDFQSLRPTSKSAQIKDPNYGRPIDVEPLLEPRYDPETDIIDYVPIGGRDRPEDDFVLSPVDSPKEANITCRCRKCGQAFKAPASFVGKFAKCPKCRHRFKVTRLH